MVLAQFMYQIPNLQPVQEPKYHFFKKKSFGILMASFLVLRILTEVFYPNKNYTLASDLTPNNILNAVNKERSLRNLVILNTNDKLGTAAQSKATDMITRKYFAHVDPDGHYIWDKIVAAGYSPYAQLGENLAVEFYDTDSLMAAWMNSPTHRANILQEGFRDQGMGLGFGDVQEGQYYSSVANTFGTLAISKTIQAPKTTTPSNNDAPKVTPTKPVKTVPTNPKPTKPTSTTTPTPQATSPVETPTTTPTATTDPTPTSIITPILVRGSETPKSVESNFALPVQNTATEITPTQSQPSLVAPTDSAPAVIGTKDTTEITNYTVNRYLILICGIFLLLLLGTDIKTAIEKKFGSLDKKINNLALLVITLVVVAFMYWF